MLYTVTNGSRHPRVVYAAGRGVLVPMGASRPVEMSEAEAENAKAEGVTIEAAVPSDGPGDDGVDLRAQAAALLAAADGMNFMKFKSAAAKILMEGSPATKDDIVAALQHVVEAGPKEQP